MRALDLELARRRPRWPAWLMAGVGAVLAFDALSSYLGLREQAQELTRQRSSHVARALPAEAMTEETRREYEAARRLLLDLALPWERLFGSIEGAVDQDTALLAIEPDAAKQTLQITGEARDYLAVLAFMARLEQDRMLTRVHLVNHELREDAPEQPTQFTLAANWRSAP
jgi:Tfp pilus assembly protein PilN